MILLLLSIVNLDDCWQVSRDAEGTIQADPIAFPSGIPALADYVHSKKLKFGVYSGIEVKGRGRIRSFFGPLHNSFIPISFESGKIVIKNSMGFQKIKREGESCLEKNDNFQPDTPFWAEIILAVALSNGFN
jgi:hypothetical protein